MADNKSLIIIAIIVAVLILIPNTINNGQSAVPDRNLPSEGERFGCNIDSDCDIYKDLCTGDCRCEDGNCMIFK